MGWRGRSVRVAAWLLAGGLGGLQLLQPALAAGRPPELVVSGEVAGLQAGVPSPLVLTVRNPGDVDAIVARLEVTVTSGGGSCPASALVVQDWRGRLLVPAGGSAQQSVQAVLAADCGDARFDLHYESHGL